MTFFLASVFVVFVFWRPQEWILFDLMYGWPILDVVVSLSVVSLFLESNEGRIRIPWRAPQTMLLVGLWFAALMSHVAHTYFAGMMETIVPMFKICFFTFLFFTTLDSPARLRKVAWMFVVVACVMTLHALLQQKNHVGFMGNYPIWCWDRVAGEWYTRSWFFGIFSDPNDLAQFLATSIPFTFVLFKRKSFLTFLVGCAVSWYLFQGMLSTHSRGGMVALMAIAVTATVLALPARWMPTMLGIMVIAAIAFAPFSGKIMDQSAHDRVVFWGEANYAFKRNPLFGVGYGMLGDYTDDRAVHNAFVACYTQLGLFGYWFWFGLIYIGVIGCYRARVALSKLGTANERWMRNFAGMSVASMVGFTASAYFLSRTFLYPMFFLFAILGAVPRLVQSMLPKDHPPLIDVRKDLYVVGTTMMLASVIYIYVSIIILNKVWYG